MKIFNKLKKMKLSKFQIIFIVILMIMFLYVISKMICSLFKICKKCRYKEGYTVGYEDEELSTLDENDNISMNHKNLNTLTTEESYDKDNMLYSFIDSEENNTTLLSPLSSVEEQNLGATNYVYPSKELIM